MAERRPHTFVPFPDCKGEASLVKDPDHEAVYVVDHEDGHVYHVEFPTIADMTSCIHEVHVLRVFPPGLIPICVEYAYDEAVVRFLGTLPFKLKEYKSIVAERKSKCLVFFNGRHIARYNTCTGVMTHVAGSGAEGHHNGTGTYARFHSPNFSGLIAHNSKGELIVADTLNRRLRRVSNGAVSDLAGDGEKRRWDGIHPNCSFTRPVALAVDAKDNISVVDLMDRRSTLRRISREGRVQTLDQVPYPNTELFILDNVLFFYQKRTSRLHVYQLSEPHADRPWLTVPKEFRGSPFVILSRALRERVLFWRHGSGIYCMHWYHHHIHRPRRIKKS